MSRGFMRSSSIDSSAATNTGVPGAVSQANLNSAFSGFCAAAGARAASGVALHTAGRSPGTCRTGTRSAPVPRTGQRHGLVALARLPSSWRTRPDSSSNSDMMANGAQASMMRPAVSGCSRPRRRSAPAAPAAPRPRRRAGPRLLRARPRTPPSPPRPWPPPPSPRPASGRSAIPCAASRSAGRSRSATSEKMPPPMSVIG